MAGPVSAQRPSPAKDLAPAHLDDDARRHAAGLMRVNHTGEVCAQALYEGQALVAQAAHVRRACATPLQRRRSSNGAKSAFVSSMRAQAF